MIDDERTREAFEQALEQAADAPYCLRLFITGASERSSRAIANVRRILDARLPGQYTLEVVDILQHPEELEAMLVFAAPTLVKSFPPPVKRLIGDMSNQQKVLLGLGLQIDDEEAPA